MIFSPCRMRPDVRPVCSAASDPLAIADETFLDDLQQRSFNYFIEQQHPVTGLIADRAPTGGIDPAARYAPASIAATGFGLTAFCIGAQRGWMERDEARRRVHACLAFLLNDAPHERGFFYHFVEIDSGRRAWRCELSSIDTALLMAGVLAAREFFDDAEIRRCATALFDRIDWPWMLDGELTLSLGWKPERGFLPHRWDNFSEHPLMYLMGIGADTHPLPAECWRAWRREPYVTYADRTFLQCGPLFTHQFPHAWVDFRSLTDGTTDFFANSVDATLAHRQFCIDLAERNPRRFGHYSADCWGITASDTARGYRAWGGPPVMGRLDGTVVPCAAAGSLPFAPAECLQTLRALVRPALVPGERSATDTRSTETSGLRRRASAARIVSEERPPGTSAGLKRQLDRLSTPTYGRYGFADAFNPRTGWVSPDAIGIDVGITLLMAENLRSGFIWQTAMRAPEFQRGLARAGFIPNLATLDQAA